MVVGVVMLFGTAQPSIQRSARRFMLASASGRWSYRSMSLLRHQRTFEELRPMSAFQRTGTYEPVSA